jgi:UPF0755 protein
MSRTAWATVLLTALLVLASLAMIARWMYEHRIGTFKESVIIIPKGSSFQTVVDLLSHHNALVYPFFFYASEGLLGHHRFYPSGEFRVPAGLTYQQLSVFLRRAKPVQHPIRVVEGSTVAAVVQYLNDHPVLTGHIDNMPAEGTLFAETYYVSRGADRQQMLNRMQTMMQKQLSALWNSRSPDMPLKTPEEAMILASIVEKESGGKDDQTYVASVFLNRLKAGMPLQADPTIIYALSGGSGRLNRPLNRQDWTLDSPYNTYLQTGLPPSPIAIPSEASLRAVLNPITTPYYYFVADGQGGHIFSTSLSDHNRHVRAFYRTKKEASLP